MPIIPEASRVDFLSKQVLTVPQHPGGRVMTLAMGGLDYQVEHHLFPSMARPNLRAANVLVVEHCDRAEVVYTETTLWVAFGTVIGYSEPGGPRRPAAVRLPDGSRIPTPLSPDGATGCHAAPTPTEPCPIATA